MRGAAAARRGRRRWRVLAGAVLGIALASAPAGAQIFRPQAPTGLSVTYQAERLGGSRLLVFGDIRNTSGQAYEHVAVLAEGLDENGQVVSRGRGYVQGVIPPRGQVSYEVRLLSAGREKKFRVTVDSYQIASPATGGRDPVQSP